MWPFRRGRSAQTASGRAGARGEKAAERFLRRAGYAILARNYRCPAGEADLIALDPSGEGGEAIVFVEVKTRATDRHVGPESAVDARKRRQLTRVASYYLARHDTADRPVRFDVVAVVAPAAGRCEVRHIPDAFSTS